MAQLHLVNPQRGKHFAPHKLLITAAGDALNRQAKQNEAEIRVGVTLARRKIERKAEHVLQNMLRRHGQADIEFLGDVAYPPDRVERLGPIPAAAMLQELVDRDVFPPRIELRSLPFGLGKSQHIPNPIFQMKLLAFDKLQHGRRRERFCHARQPKQRRRLDGLFGFAVGVSDSAGIHQSTAAQMAKAAPGNCSSATKSRMKRSKLSSSGTSWPVIGGSGFDCSDGGA